MKGVQAAVLGGSALVLLILALRLTLKDHLPRRLFPALWCTAAIRFLLPVEIPTRLSVWNLLRGTAEPQTAPIASALLPFPQLSAAQTASAAGTGPDWRLLLWFGIAALLAAYFAAGYVCMTRRFHPRRILPQPSVDALLDRFRFLRDPRICVTESRRAPLTFGVFRPTVLLPDDLPAGQPQFQLVLAHELAHIRRRDCLRKLLLIVCLCLYWWNPLVWIMVRLANRDMELACDEAVLRALGPACKKPYALALLDMAQRQTKPSPLCSSFAKSCAEERVRAILRFRRLPVWTGALTAVLFLLAAYFAAGYVCMTRQFHPRRILPQPSVDALLDRFRFLRDPRICVTESRRAPLTFGVFRPTVLLPDDLPAGQPQFQLVLAHELAHIRRRDCLRKLLLIVCLCLYWWNPLVWIMVRLANRDMELACDEAVLRALGPACKKPYALALLDMAQRQTKPSPLCSSFAKSCAEERVRAILRFRRLPVWTGALTAVLFLLAAGVLATQAQTAARVPEAPAAMQEQAETPEAPVNQPVIHIDPVITPAPAAQEPEAEAPAYVWPLEDADAAVTDAYGWTVHPLTQKESFHSGVDLEAEAGQNVLAVAAGTVLDCSYSEAYGYHVTLEHENGVQTMYAHLRAFYVESGDTVAQGQVIAAVGETGWATGPHLHLSVFRDGEAVDPLDALASALE